ncbi:MAG: GNAT family N-acetyltransferase [Nocardia sp.]|nr:GNAT family N-acetyltransferase [Nocardia sp.]NUS92315.1 GNAT family N-acetyltransferase [Nocardia sp.]
MSTAYPPALSPGIVPPQRFDLGDLVVRRWETGDITAQLEAINASFEHLHPWMAWLPAPRTADEQRAYNDVASTNWPPPDGHFGYGIFDSDGVLLGAAGLHDQVGPATLEIGYWCHIAHTGRGVITRAAAALTEVALRLPGIEQVQIRCDAANERSAAVARRLGYRLERIVARAPSTPAESGHGLVFVTRRRSGRPSAGGG